MNSRFFRKSLSGKFKPYVPGEQVQGDVVKLNTNENPYPVELPLPDREMKDLQRYPDPLCSRLRAALAEKWNVTPDMIIAGNGSDELLRYIFQAFIDPGESVGTCIPTYVLYRTLAGLFQAEFTTVPFEDDFSLPETAYALKVKIFFLCNPNSPSGTVVSIENVERLIRSDEDRLVIVDEAYADFWGESVIGLVNKYDNLIVLRTFSKAYSLAGLRIGYAVAAESLVSAMMNVKDSYNVNLLTQALALSVLERDISPLVRKIVSERERVCGKLRRNGFLVYPSRTNFFLVVHPESESIYRKLKGRKVLVRWFDEPGLRDKLRVTVGTTEQNDIFLEELLKLR